MFFSFALTKSVHLWDGGPPVSVLADGYARMLVIVIGLPLEKENPIDLIFVAVIGYTDLNPTLNLGNNVASCNGK